MKASPNNDRISLARGQTIEVFDFDNFTGAITNTITIYDDENFYGLEFSPSGALIYVSYFVAALSFEGGINQYNLLAGSEEDISNSRILLTTPDNSGFGALQLGPDDKIYVAKVSTSYLDIIANPNLLAADSNYITEGLFLEGPESAFGLPTFIKSNYHVEFETESICEGNMVQFNANIPGSYDTILWDFGDGNSSTDENPIHQYNDFGNFDVILSVTSGVSSDSSTRTVRIFEQVNANEIDIVQCANTTNNGVATFYLDFYLDDILQNVNPIARDAIEVRFFEDALLVNDISSDGYENISNPQIIYAEILNTVSNCSTIGEVMLTVNTVESYSVTINSCEEDIGFASFDLSLANNDILANSPIDSVIQYYETYDNAISLDNELDDFYNNMTPNNQIIFARVDVGTNCYAIVQVELNVIASPFDSDSLDVFYCIDNLSESLILDSGVPVEELDQYSYNWSNGETTEEIQINEIGPITLTITSLAGCSSERIINVLPSSRADVMTIEVVDISENNSITIFVSGEGEYVYALDNENGVYQESSSFENISAGIHRVYVKDVKADCGIVSEDISVLGYPKFFTPNGDTKNDVWEIKGFSSQFPTSSIVQIYNRYGKLIAVLNEYSPYWDGSFNGNEMPTDDYWFRAKLIDGRTFNGHFTLKR
jgi:gliding motility-associated-like protein